MTVESGADSFLGLSPDDSDADRGFASGADDSDADTGPSPAAAFKALVFSLSKQP